MPTCTTWSSRRGGCGRRRHRNSRWPGRDRFGVIAVDEDYRITRFDEKPGNPIPLPGDPATHLCRWASTCSGLRSIREHLIRDAREGTKHDFGKNIIPSMIEEKRVYAFKFQDANKKAVKYWRDIGTLDAYWEANMDLVAVDPLFNLYDSEWPIRTYQGQFPPAKFVFAQDFQGGRMGVALDSIVCGGCIISGGRVQNSVLSPNVRVHDHADVRESIIMENVVDRRAEPHQTRHHRQGCHHPAQHRDRLRPRRRRQRFHRH